MSHPGVWSFVAFLSFTFSSCEYVHLPMNAPLQAATYYVATTGNDSNPGSEGAPFRTIAKGSQQLASGDTLFIRQGTYAEAMVNRIDGFVFRSGKSMDAMTRYMAYPGEEGKVVLQPPGGNFVIVFSGTSYVEVSGLVLDASKTEGGAVVITRQKDHHNRLLRNEIRNGRQGISGGGEHEIIGNRIHHMRGYGIYTGGDNGLVEGNIFYENGGYAIHLFQQSQEPSYWVICNNIFFDNGRGYIKRSSGQSSTAPAVLISRGRNNRFYNNLVYRNHAGIFVGYGASDTLVANNTVYGNDDYGILVSSEHSGSQNAYVVNNLVWGNKNSQINDTGTNTRLEANLTSDPQVVNVSGGDFHLQAGSPAIDKGVTLPQVPNDFDYGKRPFAAAYDIGAFESGASPAPLSVRPFLPADTLSPSPVQ